MFKGIKLFFFKKIFGAKEVGKLVTSLYKIVKPIHNVVSHILTQLESGKITETMIDYVKEVKNAVESIIGLLDRVAKFFEIKVPHEKETKSISKQIKCLKEAREEIYHVSQTFGK